MHSSERYRYEVRDNGHSRDLNLLTKEEVLSLYLTSFWFPTDIFPMHNPDIEDFKFYYRFKLTQSRRLILNKHFRYYYAIVRTL